MVRIFIPDNSVTTGAGLTGLTSSSTNLAIAYSRSLQNGCTQITGANLVTITTIGTWASPGTGKLGFKAVDATNAPGLFEVHFPDDAAAFGTSDLSDALYLNILELTTTALKIGPNMVLIPLSPLNYQDGVRLGMTALPNAVAGANGGLPLGDASGKVLLQATQTGVTIPTVTTVTNAPTGMALESSLQGLITTIGASAAGVASAVWASATRTLSTAGVQAIWDALTSALTTSGSIGKWILDKLDATVGSRLASVSYTAPLDAGGTRTALGLGSANLDTQLDALPTNAELATALAAADDATLAAIAALNNLSTGQLATALATWLTTVMTESYAAKGAAPTPAQALFMILQTLQEFSISGTVGTVKKLDGSTPASTYTLNDASTPSVITRAT